MTNKQTWVRSGVTALLAVSLFGLPGIAAARERCGNRQTYSGSSYSGYRGDRGEYRNYRNTAYRNRQYSTDAYRNRNYGYANDPYYGDGEYRSTRSTAKSAAIIGGGAAAGAVIGGLAGGGKGAAIGAAVGGVGGLIYDRKTRNRGDRW